MIQVAVQIVVDEPANHFAVATAGDQVIKPDQLPTNARRKPLGGDVALTVVHAIIRRVASAGRARHMPEYIPHRDTGHGCVDFIFLRMKGVTMRRTPTP